LQNLISKNRKKLFNRDEILVGLTSGIGYL
jgi:hypothetical protein